MVKATLHCICPFISDLLSVPWTVNIVRNSAHSQNQMLDWCWASNPLSIRSHAGQARSLCLHGGVSGQAFLAYMSLDTYSCVSSKCVRARASVSGGTHMIGSSFPGHAFDSHLNNGVGRDSDEKRKTVKVVQIYYICSLGVMVSGPVLGTLFIYICRQCLSHCQFYVTPATAASTIFQRWDNQVKRARLLLVD